MTDFLQMIAEPGFWKVGVVAFLAGVGVLAAGLLADHVASKRWPR